MKLLTAMYLTFISLSASASASANAGISDTLSVNVNSIVALQAQKSVIVFKSNSDQYQLIPGDHAKLSVSVFKAQTKNPQGLGAALWADAKNKFSLPIANHETTLQSAVTFSNINHYDQIAYNERTGAIAVITGQILCSYASNYDAKFISEHFDIKLISDFPHLKTAFYRVHPWQDLFSITKSLNQSGLVASAEVEVIENFAMAN